MSRSVFVHVSVSMSVSALARIEKHVTDTVMAFPNAWECPPAEDREEDEEDAAPNEAAAAAVGGAAPDGGGGAAPYGGGGVGDGYGLAPGAGAHVPVALAVGGGVNMWSAAAMIGDPNYTALKDLTGHRRDLQKRRDALNRQLRNTEKKRTRLLERARSLSSDDLLAIVAARAAAKAKPKPKAKGAAKAKAKAKEQ